MHYYCTNLPSYQVQMYSTTKRRHTCYQCEIHVFCRNFSEIDIHKIETEELMDQLRWLLGLKLIQLRQQKTQLPLIILAKNLKPVPCKVIKAK